MDSNKYVRLIPIYPLDLNLPRGVGKVRNYALVAEPGPLGHCTGAHQMIYRTPLIC